MKNGEKQTGLFLTEVGNTGIVHLNMNKYGSIMLDTIRVCQCTLHTTF